MNDNTDEDSINRNLNIGFFLPKSPDNADNFLHLDKFTKSTKQNSPIRNSLNNFVNIHLY
jgi:hypothetical protein